MKRVKELGGEGTKGVSNPGVCQQVFPSFPSLTSIFLFFLALAPFSAQAKHQKSRSLVFLCSQTPRKRFLRRLRFTVSNEITIHEKKKNQVISHFTRQKKKSVIHESRKNTLPPSLNCCMIFSTPKCLNNF